MFSGVIGARMWGLMLAELQHRFFFFLAVYSNVVDCVVAAIRTLSSSGALVTYSCGGPVLSNFIFQSMKRS